MEIADWVRSLGLTILKGVIETRMDKIWACFTVEVIYKLVVCLLKKTKVDRFILKRLLIHQAGVEIGF